MQYGKLGKSGIIVSVIGFGCWGIGGVTQGATSYGPTDDATSLDTLKRAFDLGITFYDTADVYGDGHSEQLLGQSFASCRDRVVIASKVGMRGYDGPPDFSPSYIRQSLTQTLHRLQSDYVDVYQLHNPPSKLLGETEVWDTLLELKQSGHIRAIGVSARSPDEGLGFLSHDDVDSIQVNFSISDQRVLANGFLDGARKKNVGIIARTPLNFGFLSGKYSENSFFDSRDHRSHASWEKRRQWAERAQLFATLNKEKSRTLAQFALSFCIAHAAVATVIPGMMRIEEVEENAHASTFALSKEELKEIHILYKTYV